MADNKLKQTTSMVDHPAHYTQGKYECIDVMEDLVDKKQVFNKFSAGCWMNAFKYIWRVGNKHSDTSDTKTDIEKAIQDIDKSIWYLTRLKATLNKNIKGNPNEN